MSPELLLVLLLFITGGCTFCPLKLSPPSVVVRYGHPVAITCSSLSDQTEKIGWEKRTGNLTSSGAMSLTWTVDSMTEWDAPPICFLKFSNKSQCQLSSTIVVYSFPDSIHIDSTAGPNRSLKENTTYTFTCKVPDVGPAENLMVKLYRGDTVIETHPFDKPQKGAANQLSVTDFVPSRGDNGVAFRCEAILDLEKQGGPKLSVSSEPYRVNVTFGPVVSCLKSVYEWDMLENLCNVTGNPTPDVTWLHNGKPVNSTLSLSRGYTGVYAIKAEGASLVSQVLQPAVMYKPELNCQNVYTVLEHTPHSFNCTVSGYPKPSIAVYKDNEEVALPENLTRQDAGQYLIVANNSMAKVNTTADITVHYPPSQIAELEDTEVDAGSPFWLKCSSTGNPRPHYEWTYYRTEGVVEESDDGVSRLHVDNATALNAGSYKCQARNDRGKTERTVRVRVKGAEPECPIKISVEKMVIPYQSEGREVLCAPTVQGSANIIGNVSWKLEYGKKTNSTQLFVDPHKDWDLQVSCSGTFQGLGTCKKPFHLTLYKKPDSVSITRLDNLSSVVEKQQFQLRCDIIGVAPVRHLTVQWFQGNKTVPLGVKESLHVTGCPGEKVTGCDVKATRHPVNVSSTITVALDRSDSGTMFRCDAQLDLGLQILPTTMSSPLNITVNYKPTINITKLPKVVPLFHGYPEELSCKAEGYPPPKIEWFYSSDKSPRVSGDVLVVTEAGYYNCTATNEVESTFHVVEVILKEDYLPLIAGLVAIVVIAISVVFVFVYSIYYKNTKMRQYSLKNPKHNPQNGNVAHNSWDSQFSMAKLS